MCFEAAEESNIQDEICEVKIIYNFNSPSIAVFIILEENSPKNPTDSLKSI